MGSRTGAVWELMEDGRHQEAQVVHDQFVGPFLALAERIQSQTAGEGIFVKPRMEAAGVQGGYSRLPTRDEAVTPEIRDGFRRLLEEAKARAEVAA